MGGESKYDMSLFSRYCREYFIYTSPRQSIRKFIKDINYNIRKHDVHFLLPTSEATILACNSMKNEIKSELLIPTSNEIEVMFHKFNTLKLAELLKVKIPQTFLINNILGLNMNDYTMDILEL